MKIKFLLLLCIATLGLASCKKETYIQDTQNRTFNYTILPSDWTTSDNGLTYSTTLNVNEIDQITLDDEGVLVYLNHPSDVSNPDAYIQLPYVYNVDAYSYKLSKGKIRIDIQSSDYQNNLAVKPTKKFKSKNRYFTIQICSLSNKVDISLDQKKADHKFDGQPFFDLMHNVEL